jgi:YVTN family beta-propeller protein
MPRTRTIAVFLMTTALGLAACGDNLAVAPDAPLHDAAPDAPTPPRAAIAAGDFNPGDPGVLSIVDPMTHAVRRNAAPGGSVGDDPVLRHVGNELYVVNRSDGNNVTVLDPDTHQLIEQIGTGAGSNPQDVAVVGSKLYVPVLGGTGVVVLTRGQTAIATIDLGADDPDGKPDCASAFAVDGQIYVACDLLDASFAPRGPGKVYVIDSASDTVVHSFTLQTKNPIGLIEQLRTGELAVPTVDFSNSAGCVEKFTTGATPASAGCIVANADMGGYASRIEFQPSGSPIMWIAVSAYPNGSLRAFDLTTNALWTGSVSVASEIIGDVAACPDSTVVVADKSTTSGGVRLYKEGQELTTAPLDIGLAPSSPHGLLCY